MNSSIRIICDFFFLFPFSGRVLRYATVPPSTQHIPTLCSECYEPKWKWSRAQRACRRLFAHWRLNRRKWILLHFILEWVFGLAHARGCFSIVIIYFDCVQVIAASAVTFYFLCLWRCLRRWQRWTHITRCEQVFDFDFCFCLFVIVGCSIFEVKLCLSVLHCWFQPATDDE